MKTNKYLLFLLFFVAKSAFSQNIKLDALQGVIRDTTFILAKEHCPDVPATCTVGDDLYISRMIVYSGNDFWKNYNSVFYFDGINVISYQERNHIAYDYLEKLKSFLDGDNKNDSNVVIIENKRKHTVDSFYYKLYKVHFKYAFVHRKTEYVPNFYNMGLKGKYLGIEPDVYFIVGVISIDPYNAIPAKDRIIAINKSKRKVIKR